MDRRWQILICLFFALVLMNFLFFSSLRHEDAGDAVRRRTTPQRRKVPPIDSFVADKEIAKWFYMLQRVNHTISELTAEALARVEADKEAGRRPVYHTAAPGALPVTFSDERQFEVCLSSPDFLHLMTDLDCMAAWMVRLHLAAVDRVTKEEDIAIMGKRGAFRAHLGGRTKGYFKMCPPLKEDNEIDEDWKAEIMAFHISGLLGLNRTNPVVGRTFSKWELVPVIAESRWYYLKDWCGDARSEELAGAMIGWNPHQLIFPLEGRVPKLYPEETELEEFRQGVMGVNSRSAREDLSWAMEVAALQIFEYLIDYQKQTHNIFQATRGVTGEDKFGPLVIVDNDRGRWDRDISFSRTLTCRVCKFPLPVVERLRSLGPQAPRDQRMASVLELSLAFDPQQLVTVEPRAARNIDARVASVLSCVDACLKALPEEDVLLPFLPYYGRNF